jgi:hypothetical protein
MSSVRSPCGTPDDQIPNDRRFLPRDRQGYPVGMPMIRGRPVTAEDLLSLLRIGQARPDQLTTSQPVRLIGQQDAVLRPQGNLSGHHEPDRGHRFGGLGRRLRGNRCRDRVPGHVADPHGAWWDGTPPPADVHRARLQCGHAYRPHRRQEPDAARTDDVAGRGQRVKEPLRHRDGQVRPPGMPGRYQGTQQPPRRRRPLRGALVDGAVPWVGVVTPEREPDREGRAHLTCPWPSPTTPPW